MKNRTKKKQFPNKQLKASATIEAAVVIPVTLVIIAAVLTIVFVLHDRVILNTASLYEVMEQAGAGEDPQELRSAVSDMLQKRLVTAAETSVSADVKEDGVQIDAGGSVQIPLRMVRFLVGEENQQVEAQIRVSNLSGRKLLIKYKTLCDGLSALGKEEE